METNNDKAFSEEGQTTGLSLACEQCGADLQYSPGTAHLKCPYCSHQNEIPVLDSVEELDFEAFANSVHAPEAEVWTVSCRQCGAVTRMEEHLHAGFCGYCNGPLVASDMVKEKLLEPAGLISFKINNTQAQKAFQQWIRKQWFLPSKLRTDAKNTESLVGQYIPFWTFDAHSETTYVGQRGTYYYVTIPYTTVVNGKTVVRTRQQRKTSWRTISGSVTENFDDILVCASRKIPEHLLKKMGLWNLGEVLKFRPEFLAGFRAEKYQTSLKEGLTEAKTEMEARIQAAIRAQIGGDEQRILEMHPEYSDLRFKHVLLPVWMSAYRHKNKTFRFIINGQTGKVASERPYDAWKISLVVLLGLGLAGLIIWLISKYLP